MAFTKVTMMKQEIEQPIKELVLPKPHYLTRLVRANETYILAGRGTFKTSRGIALYMVDMIYEMPKSTGVCVGLSFEHLGDNTLPPLLEALEEFGFEHGVHYVVGKRPPVNWPKPFRKVKDDKYDHTICWHNGTVLYLVSLVKKASANGISAQWGFFDEVKFMDEKDLVDEIFPIFRGNEATKKRYGSSSGYLSKLFATDKLADPVKINWLLNKRKLQDQNKIKACIALQLRLNDLEMQFESAGKTKKKDLALSIAIEKRRLTNLRSNMVYVTELSAYDVLYAHGEKWLKDKERNSGAYKFDIIYRNLDPVRPGDSFYPAFDQAVHTYHDDYDIDPGKALIISIDYQHSVSPITICQLNKLPGRDDISLNYVDEVYTLATPEEAPLPNGNGMQGGLTNALELFCARYKGHIRKTVHYVYDHTAVGKRVDALTHKESVIKTLKANGWFVVEVYTGHAPDHYLKYKNTMDWMQRKSDDTYPININADRCPSLIASITGAPAKTKNGKTEKDKDSEKETTLDQSKTTHFSDAFDMANHAVLKLKRIKTTTEVKRMSSR